MKRFNAKASFAEQASIIEKQLVKPSFYLKSHTELLSSMSTLEKASIISPQSAVFCLSAAQIASECYMQLLFSTIIRNNYFDGSWLPLR